MGYEIFTRKLTRVTAPTVTFTKAGRIALNKAATRTFEKDAVEFVLMMWDAEERKVGIRPITKRDNRAYQVRYGGKGHTAGFHGATFLTYIGYDFRKEGTKSFAADWNADAGILEVSLKGHAAQAQQPLLAVGEGRARRVK